MPRIELCKQEQPENGTVDGIACQSRKVSDICIFNGASVKSTDDEAIVAWHLVGRIDPRVMKKNVQLKSF